MKLRDLLEQLHQYNQEADVAVIVHNKREEFSVSFGSSDGCTKETCDNVGFYVDYLNGHDEENTTHF